MLVGQLLHNRTLWVPSHVFLFFFFFCFPARPSALPFPPALESRCSRGGLAGGAEGGGDRAADGLGASLDLVKEGL